MENPSTTPPSAITSNDRVLLCYAVLDESVGYTAGHGLFFVDGKERQGSLPGDLPRQGLAEFSRCRTSKRHTSKDYLAPHRLPGTPLALLFDAAARIQVVFACHPHGVLVYFGPRQDITLGEAGEGSITAELGLVEGRVVFLEFHRETGSILRVLVFLNANPLHLLAFTFTDQKVIRICVNFSVSIQSNLDENLSKT